MGIVAHSVFNWLFSAIVFFSKRRKPLDSNFSNPYQHLMTPGPPFSQEGSFLEIFKKEKVAFDRADLILGAAHQILFSRSE
jgi:hypothetical protein